MTTIVTADLHRNANARDDYRHRWWHNFLLPMVARYDADRALLLGDLTDQKDYHGSILTNRIVDDMAQLAKECDVIDLQGNHDYTSAPNPFFGFLKHLPNIRWIKEVTELDLGSEGSCLFIPHLRQLSDWEALTLLRQEDWDWVFTHATFTGAKSESGEPLDGIPIELVRDQEVISGDVHVPQKHRSVTYVGAPYRINFGDTYEPRILVLKGRRMQSVPSLGPRKVLLEIADLRELDRGEQREGDIIKVRYKIRAEDYDRWPEIHRAIAGWATRYDLVLESAVPVPLIEQAARDRPRITRRADPRNDRDVLKAYCNRYKVGGPTLEVGLSIMERA